MIGSQELAREVNIETNTKTAFELPISKQVFVFNVRNIGKDERISGMPSTKLPENFWLLNTRRKKGFGQMLLLEPITSNEASQQMELYQDLLTK